MRQSELTEAGNFGGTGKPLCGLLSRYAPDAA
jgi:hypothetical protein